MKKNIKNIEKKKEKILKKPELMAPAGDWIKLRAAVQNGADAVYLGLKSLNMRATANNFSNEELKDVVNYCHKNNVKVYLTLNNIIFNDQIDEMKRLVNVAKRANVDMIICWDHSVIKECLKQKIDVCLSTQASVSNVEAARFYKDIGVKRIVLARECTLKQITEIKKEFGDKLEIEVFVHGAMCVSLSGRCFISHHLYGKEGSANCGKCLQPCRREYIIKDVEGEHELIVGRGYVMSAKDLCTIEFINDLINSGVDAFKIEGRKRSPEYVAMSTKIYREAIDKTFINPDLITDEINADWKRELKKVFNRGFNTGFFYEFPSGKKSVTDEYGSKATQKKEYVGLVENYFNKNNVVLCKIESTEISVGDNLMIQGPTTGIIHFSLEELRDVENNKVNKGLKKNRYTFKIKINNSYKTIKSNNNKSNNIKIRKNDKIYLIKSKT